MMEYSNVLDILNTKSTNRVFTAYNFLNQKKHDVDSSNVIAFYKSYCDSLFIKDLKQWNIHPVFCLGEVTSGSIPIIVPSEDDRSIFIAWSFQSFRENNISLRLSTGITSIFSLILVISDII